MLNDKAVPAGLQQELKLPEYCRISSTKMNMQCNETEDWYKQTITKHESYMVLLWKNHLYQIRQAKSYNVIKCNKDEVNKPHQHEKEY